MFRLIAREMAVIHSIDPEQVVSELDEPFIHITKTPCAFTKMMSFLDALPEDYPDPVKEQRYEQDIIRACFTTAIDKIKP